jgi:hypothetical protein
MSSVAAVAPPEVDPPKTPKPGGGRQCHTSQPMHILYSLSESLTISLLWCFMTNSFLFGEKNN